MLIGPADVASAVLLVVGMVWSKEVFGRFATDLAEVRDPSEPVEAKVAIGAVWLITAGLLAWTTYRILDIVRGIASPWI